MTIERHHYSKMDGHAMANHLQGRFRCRARPWTDARGQVYIEIYTHDQDITYMMDDRQWLAWSAFGDEVHYGEGACELYGWLSAGDIR